MPTSHVPSGSSLSMQLESQARPLLPARSPLGNGNFNDAPWVEDEENIALGSAPIREVDAGPVNHNPVLPPAYDSSWASRRRESSQVA